MTNGVRPAGGVSQEVFVGTINLLGDAFNPFEFLPLKDEEYMKNYNVLQASFQDLGWSDIEDSASALLQGVEPQDVWQSALSSLKEHCAKDKLWTFFTEKVLSKDNKLVDQRINLLTMAMKVTGGSQQSDLVGDTPDARWLGTMRSQLGEKSYTGDSNLFLFDIVCNVVASRNRPQYEAICRGSYLNPGNYEAIARTYLECVEKQNTRGLPVVVGFQEYPNEGTDKDVVYKRLLQDLGYRYVIHQAGDIALAYKGFGSDELRLLTPDVFTPRDIMQRCIDAVPADTLNAKARGGLLDTTARKSMAVEIGNSIFIVVHAKEPKDPKEAAVLARFMRELGSTSQQHCAVDGLRKGWVLLTDTNIGVKDAVTRGFQSALHDEECGPGVVWMPEKRDGSEVVAPTTSKHRSVLHGQCYDTNKCRKTVAAAKDYLIASLPGKLEQCQIYPDLQIENGVVSRTLPAPDWGSDHCLVTAVYVSFGSISGTHLQGILEAFKQADKLKTGTIPQASLKWLFQQLDSVVFAGDEIDTLMQKSGTVENEQVRYDEFLRWLFFLEVQ